MTPAIPPPRRRGAARPRGSRPLAEGRVARARGWVRERGLFGRIVLVGIVAFAAGYVVVLLLFFPGFGRSPIVTVPDVRGRPAAAAERAIERAGLEAERTGELPHPTVPAGAVLTQVPLPGEEVSRGSAVRVVLSSGPARRAVPAIQGMSADEARRLLEATGFAVEVDEVPAPAAEGSVLGVEPAPGTLHAVPSVVRLRVSAGPPRVGVPEIVGVGLNDARARLEAAGLRLGGVVYDPFAPGAWGTVLSQSPAPGDSARMGSGIRVTVAGEDPEPPPPPDDEPFAEEEEAFAPDEPEADG